MRNLKRALSLALASVMLMGMMVVGSSAAGYPDVDSADNVEAIEVLNAVGIMTGDANGNFNPDQKVTRNEMAVVMANLLKLTVNDFGAISTPFTDVPSWAAKYVAACYADGIVAGTSATTFGGEESVTAVQAGLMILKALGYFQYAEDFGDDWSLATIRQASSIDLFDGIDAGRTDALTRNEVARLVLNALQADVVNFTGTVGTDITTTDGTVIKVGYKSEYTALTSTYNYNSAAVGTHDQLSRQLAEQLFQNELTLNTSSYKDSYGRPANTWAYKSVTIGKYGKDADLVFTAGASGSTTNAKLTNMGIKDYNVGSGANLTVNGAAQANVTALTSIPGLTGNGVVVELFLHPTIADRISDIVVTKTELVQVTSKTASRITMTSENTAVVGSLYITNEEDLFKTASAYSVDDYLLVTPVYDAAASRYVVDEFADPEVVKGNITALAKNSSGDNTKITLDGTEFPVSGVAANPEVTGAGVDTKNESTLWLDAYGNVIFAEASTPSADKFLYVLKAYSTLKDGKIVPMVQAVKTNGEIVDVEVTGASATDSTLFQVSGVSNDVYTLVARADLGNAGSPNVIAAVNNSLVLSTGAEIKASDKGLTVDNAGNSTNGYVNYYSSKVVFVYADTTNHTATVKQGVQRVPSITAGSYVVTEANSSTDPTPVVTMVVLKDDIATNLASDDLLYISSATSTGSVSMYNKNTQKYDTVPTYDAYKNGEKLTIATSTSVSADTFYTYAESESNGSLVLASHTATSGSAAVQGDKPVTVTFDKRMITVNGSALDITSAIITDLRSAQVQADDPIALSAAGICEAVATYSSINVSVIYDADTGVASHVYVLSQADGYTITPATIAPETGYTISTSHAKAAIGETITVTVSVTDAGAGRTLTFAPPTGATATSATTASHTAGTAATYTFTYVMNAPSQAGPASVTLS